MIDVLAASPLLTFMLVVALGTAIGKVRFGPLRFGAAGALFVGLAVGAIDPRLGEGLGLVQSIGLALFVYTIGIAAGASFFRDLRTQTPVMLGAAALLAVLAALTVLTTRALGIDGATAGGLFAGMLTATPALAAATDAASGSSAPAVGYSIAYPVGVLVTMLALTWAARQRLPGGRDPASPGETLLDITVEVDHPMRIADIPDVAEVSGRRGGLRVSYLVRDDEVRVASPEEALSAGDLVVLVGHPDSVTNAAGVLGRRISRHLAHDRSVVDYRRFVLSNPALAGRTVADLHIPSRYGGIITRIRRGDTDLLAQADMPLQLGDRVRVVAPRDRMADLGPEFGDSEKGITEVDFHPFGLGMALGVALGLITIPLGGASLALGSAAGPLLVGLVLGRIGRTRDMVWAMPLGANLTVRQLGLTFFLAAVGLSSGQAFASTAFTLTGLTVLGVATALLCVALAGFWAMCRVLGLSTPRAAGAMAGLVGQPVLLDHTTTLVDDDRAESGYSALFALGMIVKIVVVQAIVAV